MKSPRQPKSSSASRASTGFVHRNPKQIIEIARVAGNVMQHFDYMELSAVKESIQRLLASIAAAEAQLADCHVQMNSEQQMVDQIIAKSRNPSPDDKLSLKACRLGLKAWKASIKAFQLDINGYRSKIEALKEDLPIALHEFLSDGVEVPGTSLIFVEQVPLLVRSLSRGEG